MSLIIGISGFSGSGKTTLIEALIPVFIKQGLKVATIKHNTHGLDFDYPEKDTERFFAAGADIAAHDSRQTVIRLHQDAGLSHIIKRLGTAYDLILVEGHKSSPLDKLWCLAPGKTNAPPGIKGIIALLPRDKNRVTLAEKHILSLLL